MGLRKYCFGQLPKLQRMPKSDLWTWASSSSKFFNPSRYQNYSPRDTRTFGLPNSVFTQSTQFFLGKLPKLLYLSAQAILPRAASRNWSVDSCSHKINPFGALNWLASRIWPWLGQETIPIGFPKLVTSCQSDLASAAFQNWTSNGQKSLPSSNFQNLNLHCLENLSRLKSVTSSNFHSSNHTDLGSPNIHPLLCHYCLAWKDS